MGKTNLKKLIDYGEMQTMVEKLITEKDDLKAEVQRLKDEIENMQIEHGEETDLSNNG